MALGCFCTRAFAVLSLLMVIQGGESKSAATESLCSRLPSLTLCRYKRQTQKQEDDLEVYCPKWDKHYEFYCIGLGTGDQRAREFCPYYKKACNVKDKPFVTAPPLPNSGGGLSPNLPRANLNSVSSAQQTLNRPSGVNNGGGTGSFTQPLAFLGGNQQTNQPFGVPNPGTGSAPLAIGQGFSAPFANAFSGTNVDPFRGFNTGTTVDAAGLPVTANRGVSFGGLIPGGAGLSNLFAGR